MIRRSTLAAVLLCSVTGPLLAADGDVRHVTQSSGGLCGNHARARRRRKRTIRITVTAEQVDDLLKSLVVRDPAGSVGGLTLYGPAQAEETFRRLSFAAEDLASLARLLGRRARSI